MELPFFHLWTNVMGTQQGVDLDISPNGQRLGFKCPLSSRRDRTGAGQGMKLELTNLYKVKILEGTGRSQGTLSFPSSKWLKKSQLWKIKIPSLFEHAGCRVWTHDINPKRNLSEEIKEKIGYKPMKPLRYPS